MVFMEGPSGSCFNYSDCAPGSLPCLAQWYFAWKFKDMSVLYLEQDRVDGYKSSSEARLLPLIAFYAADVVPASISAPSEHIFSGDGVTPVVLVHDTWTMGTDDRFLGIKAGQGNTSHAHLDAGSFVYDADGVRWAADLGLQSYSTLEPYIDLWNMNDNSERWTAFRYNNLNHNTITINGEYHRVAGAGTVGKIINKDINSTDGLLPASFEGYQIVYDGNIILRLTDLQNDHRSLRTGLVTQTGIITSAYTCLKVRGNILPEYLQLQLHVADLCKVFYGMGGGVRQSIGFKEIRKLIVAVPSIEEQQHILECVRGVEKPVNHAIQKNRDIIAGLEDLKNRLISDVVTGKIDVRDVKIPEYEFVEEDAEDAIEDGGENDIEQED